MSVFKCPHNFLLKACLLKIILTKDLKSQCFNTNLRDHIFWYQAEQFLNSKLDMQRKAFRIVLQNHINAEQFLLYKKGQ